MNGIHSKAVDPAIEPEAQHGEHGLDHFRVAPVEVGLLRQKGVVIVLPGPLVPLPGAAAEFGQPIGRRAAVGLCIAPDIPIALAAVARGAAVDEPGMLVRSVIGHIIHENLEGAPMGLAHQAIECLQVPEPRVDIEIVRHVVAEIRHRRWKDRRYPDGVDPEIDRIIEPRDDAGEVADAIAVGVLE